MAKRTFKTHMISRHQKPDPFAVGVGRIVPKSNPNYNYDSEPGDQPCRRKKLDSFTKNLGQTYFIMKPRLHWLAKKYNLGRTEPLTVDRFYPPLKLLLDISVESPADTQDNIKLKNELAASNGFFYFNITDQKDVERLLMSVPRGA